jgi:peptide/nickel transport system ATP-binding protein
MEQEILLQVEGLKKYFPIRKGFLNKVKGYVKAVESVSFTVYTGETIGLVGESGCGKTTLGRCLVRGIEPTSGSVAFKTSSGEIIDIATLPERELRPHRKAFQMVFQDPYSSLDPRMSVFDIIAEPLRIHKIASSESDLEERIKSIARVVGLKLEHLKRYPHAFSGGQRQRIGIARALVTNPELVIADEAVSALDVSIQAQVLNLLKDLQDQFNLTYIFVAHDLSVVEYISDRVAVMYLGQIVELSETEPLFREPFHPYTEALLSAVPRPDPARKRAPLQLQGEVPNPANPPEGCAFHPRCPYAQARCRAERPMLRKISASRSVACHYAEDLSLKGVPPSDIPAFKLPHEKSERFSRFHSFNPRSAATPVDPAQSVEK